MAKFSKWVLVVLLGLPLALGPLHMDPPLYGPAALAFAVGGLVAGALLHIRGRRVCSKLFRRYWAVFLAVLAVAYVAYWVIWSNTLTSTPLRDNSLFMLVLVVSVMLGFLGFFGETSGSAAS